MTSTPDLAVPTAPTPTSSPTAPAAPSSPALRRRPRPPARDGRPGGSGRLVARLREAALHLPNWWQFGRFLAVGLTGYAVNLAVYTFCLHVVNIEYHVAAGLGFVFALIDTFALNRHWTFQAGHGSSRFQGPRFVIVNLVGFGVNLAALDFFIHVTAMGKVPAEALAAIIAAPVNFLGQRLWVFAASRHAQPAGEPPSRRTGRFARR